MSIQELFETLENPLGIFNHIHEWISPANSEFYVCYKEKSEYGTSILISDILGQEIVRLFVNYEEDEEFSTKPFYISSCSYFELTEKIFSNKTDYYINGQYYSSSIDSNLKKLIRLINQYLLENEFMYGEELSDSIESDVKIDLLSSNIFDDMPQNPTICDVCKVKFIEDGSECDFCNRKMCEDCQGNSYYHFVKCEDCGTKYCYYDGLHADYKCTESNGTSCDCANC